MGLLFSKFWSLFSSEEHKVIIVGLDNAGKTTILYQLDDTFFTWSVNRFHAVGPATEKEQSFRDRPYNTEKNHYFLMNEVVHTSPTIGSNVEEVIWKNIHFIMWDIGGQESLRASWNTYYANTEFVILVIDSTDRERLSITKEELYKMLACEDLKKAAVLIYANKQDLRGAMSAAEISRQLNLTSIKDQGWHIQGCCALTGEGLYQGLEWISNRIRR